MAAAVLENGSARPALRGAARASQAVDKVENLARLGVPTGGLLRIDQVAVDLDLKDAARRGN